MTLFPVSYRPLCLTDPFLRQHSHGSLLIWMWCCYLFDELHLCLVSPGVWSFSTPTSPSPPWCLCTPPSSLTNHTLCHITHWPIRGPLSACPSCHSQRLGIRLGTSLFFFFFFWLATCLIRLQFVLNSAFVCFKLRLRLPCVPVVAHVSWASPQHSPRLGRFRAANRLSTAIFFPPAKFIFLFH